MMNTQHPLDCVECRDLYTRTPTHVRVYREETGDDAPWHVDGADDRGHYTESVWRFRSHRAAIDNAALFIKVTASTLDYRWENRK